MVKAALANWSWFAASAPSALAFDRALEDPQLQQQLILRRYLTANANTAFGRAHGFRDIQTYQQFASRLPLHDYSDLQPWITRITQGEPAVLTAEPVRRLVPTGGSTAGSKLIPYTASLQRELGMAIAPWIADLFRCTPRASLGPAYWSITPMAPQTVAAGQSVIPIGFDDDCAYLGGLQRRLVQATLALPPGLQQIQCFDALRYLTLLLLLRTRDLALISIWHPSFLDLLLRTMRSEMPRLLRDVADGTCAVLVDLPEALRAAVCTSRQPFRAREIERADDIKQIWPRLALVSCWADAQAGASAAALANDLCGIPIQPKGLVATEGMVTIPWRGRHPLAIRSHFFEFQVADGSIRLAHELEIGEECEVILTNGGGLWRYRLNDLVEVDAMAGGTPSLRFKGKTGLVSDRRGEKLTDAFVTTVLHELFAGFETAVGFSMLAPAVGNHDSVYYTLYTDAALPADAESRLDNLLAKNPQYAYCRQLGQLDPPRVEKVGPNPYSAVLRRMQERGQQLGAIKALSLSPLDGWSAHLQSQT